MHSSMLDCSTVFPIFRIGNRVFVSNHCLVSAVEAGIVVGGCEVLERVFDAELRERHA